MPSLKTLKCMNNLIEIVSAAICEKMDLRVLDVSSNPLVQPPLETCKRGLHSMRRYYQCLKLEEVAGMTEPAVQPSPQNKCLLKKFRACEKSRVKMRKGKGLAKKAFPSSLCRSSSRTVSEPNQLSAQLADSTFGETTPPFIPRQEQIPPIRSVSFSLAKRSSEVVKHRRSLDSSLESKESLRHGNSIALKQPPRESHDLDGSARSASDAEIAFAEDLQLVDLNQSEKAPDEITVNDTLKVIFVGMALSGKTR